jgi:uncharacterized membrane protein YccF (DUF307 family)
MGGILAAIASLAAPITARVLAALGMSVITLGGASLVVGQVRDLIVTHLAGGVLDALMLAGLAGAWDALGMVFGAVTFTVTMFGLTKAVRIVGVGT